MGNYYIGTSGFSYRDWEGPFYPQNLGKEEYLSYYAQHFSFVELNFTYYRRPEAPVMEKMIKKVPPGFLFSVKAHKSLTHERGAGWKEEVERFTEGIFPLVEGECLAGVLLQFPYSFHYTRENRTYLAGLCSRLADGGSSLARGSGGATEGSPTSAEAHTLPLFTEFRNAEWIKESVREELADRSIGFVITDTPKLRNLPQPENTVTSEYAYLRLHGRNEDNWWTGDNTSRYDYLYSRQELQEFLPLLRSILNGSTRLFIAFNNHHKGQAVKNALMLREMIDPHTESNLNGVSNGI
ncbi:MAG: DUF72 domain-containing protein [Spirochaetaceae bacterium]